jgi:hypothetical protein
VSATRALSFWRGAVRGGAAISDKINLP